MDIFVQNKREAEMRQMDECPQTIDETRLMSVALARVPGYVAIG
jgi:hypothetical protein